MVESALREEVTLGPGYRPANHGAQGATGACKKANNLRSAGAGEAAPASQSSMAFASGSTTHPSGVNLALARRGAV